LISERGFLSPTTIIAFLYENYRKIKFPGPDSRLRLIALVQNLNYKLPKRGWQLFFAPAARAPNNYAPKGFSLTCAACGV
jgi:hypothetical protein